ncbi:MAG: hypothetical protein AAB642_02955, partial [Patescibacteria group bacterium]
METGELLAILVLVVFLAIPLILAAKAPEKVRALLADQTPQEKPTEADSNPDSDKPKTAA